MCGRYFLELKALIELEKRIDYEFERELLTAKDYYPGNEVPIIVSQDSGLNLKRIKWGFKTFDNKLVINARSETLLKKAMFKNEVLINRCIIPASGFYEWDQHKHKITFINEENQIMLLAGIYRIIEGQMEMAIITTSANESMRLIHRRMPLVLTDEQMKSWLSKDSFKGVLKVKPSQLKISAGILQTRLF
ncbi:MAG: SOS response-associated peptidase [Thomasclavelia sp.]|uniref:SOS response-associated peptidase n=1 Tax=Thomasclavelia sp. TaxID=3025757 RepID=UPI0039A2F3C2